jgi:hypothetical protein
MIELRWVKRKIKLYDIEIPQCREVLQYRQSYVGVPLTCYNDTDKSTHFSGSQVVQKQTLWTKWTDVPVVEEENE